MSDSDDKLEPPVDPDVESSARREAPRRATFPPTRWDGQAQVVASTGKYQTIPPVGELVDDERERLTEARAREILNARFATAGVKLIPDFAFHEGDVMVTLDGYDAGRRTGYAYISHADADVVTDFDEASEVVFNNLAQSDIAHVLLVHDHDVPTVDVLERRIDAFFAALPRTS
jgi:hypothetical protein